MILTSADLDHVLGLLLLRELQPLHIFATGSVLRILREDNSMFRTLNRLPNQAVWTEIVPDRDFQVSSSLGTDSGLQCKAVSLGTHYPAYVNSQQTASLKESEALLGLTIEAESGRRLAFMPAVPQVNDCLQESLEATDLLLFDGTFWSDDELIRVQGMGHRAREMGHIPIGSPDGSLHTLAKLRHPRKIFLHINNTNPMLDESGPEFAAVRAAGWEVAEDGWQFQL